MNIYIAKFTLIFISILIISTLVALILLFLIVKIRDTITNPYYKNIGRRLKKVAMRWGCKVDAKEHAFPKIVGTHNNFSIFLTFYNFIGLQENYLPRTLLQIKTNILKDTSLIVLKKVKNKNAYPIYMLKNVNFVKTGNIELDKYYSFISNNETESKKIIEKIEKLLFNRKHFFNNHETLQIDKKGIKYEMDKIQTEETFLTEKLSFIEEVVKRLE